MKPAKLHLLALLGAALLAALPPVARAADNNPPTQLTYQGFLTDPNGLPLGNASPVNKTVQFRIFAAESGGTALWASSQVVTVDKGHFSVLLGQGSQVGSEPFAADLTTLFTGTGASDRYVELTVDGSALAPRLRFLPAPYAMLAKKAMTVDSASDIPLNVGRVLHLGVDSTTKGAHNGKIGYGAFTTGALDIVGGGDGPADANRKIVLWSQGGVTVKGDLTADSGFKFNGSGAGLTGLVANNITTGILPNARTTATSANSANAIVARDGSGNIAVGKATASELDFGATTGHKIGLYSALGNQYGMGIGPGLLQLYAGTDGNVAFGNGSSASFSEKMRVALDGNVGIGTTAPGKRLDVAGLTRIRDHLIFNSDNAVINWGSGRLYFRQNTTVGNETTYSSATEHMVISTNGYVGIATVDPKAPLHVVKRGYNWTNLHNTDHKFDPDEAFGIYLGRDAADLAVDGAHADHGDNITLAHKLVAAIFDGQTIARDRVYVGNFSTSSDLRAKNVLGLSKPDEDLATVLKLRVTDYHWIDRSKDGHRKHKQLIAQDVEQVFPQAVTVMPASAPIPNVYEVAAALEHDAQAKSLKVTTKKAHDFKAGDKVDIMMDASPMTTVEVKAVITPHQFVVAAEKPAKKVFVYGKQVNDFRTVDYTAIAMLNVSATQELARQNEALKKRVSELESRERQVVALQKRVDELEGLERQVADLQKLVRQVAERQNPSPRAAVSENGPATVLPVSAR